MFTVFCLFIYLECNFLLSSKDVRFFLLCRSYHKAWSTQRHPSQAAWWIRGRQVTCQHPRSFPSAAAAWQPLYTFYCAGAFFWQTVQIIEQSNPNLRETTLRNMCHFGNICTYHMVRAS